MTKREWRRLKAERELRAMHKRMVVLVRDLLEDEDAAFEVAKVVHAVGHARAALSPEGFRRAG